MRKHSSSCWREFPERTRLVRADDPARVQSHDQPFTVDRAESALASKHIDHIPLFEIIGGSRFAEKSDDVGSTPAIEAVPQNQPVRDSIASTKRINIVPSLS